jgi:aspartate ammonia-lyase
MNANEVIANRALEHLGHERGEYRHLHPLEDVNMSQSTNDVYPTAVKVALHFAIRRLIEAMAELRRAFAAKAEEFADVLKMGRTQLQDAVPMTLGQEFGAYRAAAGYHAGRLVFDVFDALLADDRIATATESAIGLNGLQYSGSASMLEPRCASAFYLQISEK